jgi:hypothetical protein
MYCMLLQNDVLCAELRKALAAQRLQLKDAAHAAGGRKQPSLSQQMNSRLADMQSYMNNPMGH